MAGTGPTSADAPRTAYRVLDPRETMLVTGVLLTLAATCWWVLVGLTRDMRGTGEMSTTMDPGLASWGVAAEPFDMNAGLFLGTWVLMMAAMMLPTVAPIVLLHRRAVQGRGAGRAATAAFVGGYLSVWAAVGILPLGALVLLREGSDAGGWVAPTAGALLVVAGGYQLTPWKRALQRSCASPSAFLAAHDHGTGVGGSFRTGVAHGLTCLGCCWSLMTVLLVVGLMNLAWMTGVAVVILVEKHWLRAPLLARLVGAATIGLGVAALIQPAVLGWAA